MLELFAISDFQVSLPRFWFNANPNRQRVIASTPAQPKPLAVAFVEKAD